MCFSKQILFEKAKNANLRVPSLVNMGLESASNRNDASNSCVIRIRVLSCNNTTYLFCKLGYLRHNANGKACS